MAGMMYIMSSLFLPMLLFFFQISAALDIDIPSSTTIRSTQSTVRRPDTPTTIRSHIPHIHRPPTHLRYTPPLTFTPQLTFTQHPNPSRAPDSSRNRRGHSLNAVAIFFAVFGAIVGFGLFLGLVRFLYNYSKTPPRDRISGVMNRYQLQRELEELERNPFALRGASLREPAPPYIPRPPSYSEGLSLPRPPGPECTEVTTGSHPGSLITSQRSLEARATAPNNSLPDG